MEQDSERLVEKTSNILRKLGDVYENLILERDLWRHEAKNPRCPFIHNTFIFDTAIDCPYMEQMRCKGEMNVNVGNGDAWCTDMIKMGLYHGKG